MDEAIKLLIGPLCFSVSALIAWVWMLWQSHHNHRIDVAKNYVSHPQLEKTIEGLCRELRFVYDLTSHIAQVLKIKVGNVRDQS